MVKKVLFATLFGFLVVSLSAAEKADSKKSSIVSVSLFKNGMAFVKRKVSFDKPGKYMLTDIEPPVYGTFFVKSDAELTVKGCLVETEKKLDESLFSPLDAFEDLMVSVKLKGVDAPLKGKLIRVNEKPFQMQRYSGGGWRNFATYPSLPSRECFVVKNEKGVTYFTPMMVEMINAEGINTSVREKEPALELNVTKLPKSPGQATLSYLANGLFWAASYAIELQSADTLKITQKAVIKNELNDLENVDIKLISGFPNIKFRNVFSPLSASVSMSAFFSALNSRNNNNMNPTMYNVAVQQALPYGGATPQSNAFSFSDSGKALPDGRDIHLQDIGKYSLAKGDSLALTTDSKESAYEKIVEWLIPDSVDENGNNTQNTWNRNNRNAVPEEGAWDSIRFKNPFSFPMTTAAASIYSPEGEFLGQTISYWVNPGEETVLHITKALSLMTHSNETVSTKKTRETVWVLGRRYVKTDVEGILKVKNFRATPVKLLIKKCFSGELIQAEGNPAHKLPESGAYSVNQQNELTWEMGLAPAEEKTLKFTYFVLMRR